MARSLHVRLNDAADRDLRLLENAAGVSASTAVRDALHLAARQRQSRSSLAALAAKLAADPHDRAEMDDVRELMDDLAPDLRN